MARILILGSTGQLGTDMVRELSAHRPVALGPDEIELTDPAEVNRAVSAHRPEWVLNASAYNDVARAEEDPQPAFAVNAQAVWFIARAAQAAGARLVHFSTDYVFPGDKGDAYVESDAPHPLNVYAVSKLAGEFLAQAPGPAHVFRLSALFGTAGCRTKGGGNFVESILAQARAGKTLRVVDDMICTPTFSLDVARYLAGNLFSLAPGLYHLANAEPCSWFEFAREILAQAGLEAALEAVRPEGALHRPRNSALASEKLPALRPWRQALAEYLALRGARVP